jgi:hypothetical protein
VRPTRRQIRRRRRGAVGALTALLLLGGGVAVKTGHNPLPADIPVVGRDATDVFNDIKRAGLPVTDGTPSSSEFRAIVESNSCESSRSFVRSDSDMGWAMICVNPPASAHERLSSAFAEDVPMLTGPLYVDDGSGDVVVFGMGWPPDASKQIYDAMGASGGNYLTEQP